MNGNGFDYLSNKRSLYGGSGGGGKLPVYPTAPANPVQGQIYYNSTDDKIYYYDGSDWQEVGSGSNMSILDVNALPTQDIEENVFYRTNNVDKYFIYDNQKYQENSVVCYKCDGTYVYASGTQLNIELTPGNVNSYLWDAVDDTLINDLLNQEISGVHPIEIVSFDDCQTTVDYFIKYDTNKYDSASNFTKQIDYISQLQYYKNNEWNIVDNLQIDSIKLTPTTTRADLGLIGEEDIIKNSDFETPKANGIDWVLDDGQASNPNIINDDPAYKYANNKTSSNNYINTRLETIERKADAKTITKFVDALPANPDLNTEYYVSAGTNNYNRYFVDSLGTVRNLGSTQMDISTLATKQEVNLKQDISNLTTTVDSNSTNTQYPSAKAVFTTFSLCQNTNYYPDLPTLPVNNALIPSDDAVFNMRTQADAKNIIAEETREFWTIMTNPFNETIIYGVVKTKESVNNGNSNFNIYITQEFVQYQTGVYNKIVKFIRKGYIYNQSTIKPSQIYDNKSSITWDAWIPVEYPTKTIPTASLNTSVVTYGNIQYKITGGILVIDFNFLKFATASQNGQIITTNDNFSWISSAIAKIDCRCVIHGWKTTQAPTSGFASLAIADKKITVYDVQADNKEYYGQMIVPLGY